MKSKSRLVRITEGLAILSFLGSSAQLAAALSGPMPEQSVPMVAAITLSTLALCIVHAGATKGWAKALGFSVLSFVISWVVEFVGCNYGWWFGDYGYTNKLGVSLGNVPLLVVFSWEIVIYPALLLVDHFAGAEIHSKMGRLLHIVFASLATGLVATTWDTMTDPFSVHVGYWAWDNGGHYLSELSGGIPYSNFWGWIGAAFIISFLYRVLVSGQVSDAAKAKPSLIFPTFLFSSLFCGALSGLIGQGLYPACFIGVFTMGPIVLLAWTRLLSEQFAQKVSPATR